MKKLEELIMRDIGWKLLSVCIAAVLWFMVINIEHPVDTRAYSQMIKLENEDILSQQGLAIQNKDEIEDTKAVIKVKAQRTALDRLGQYKSMIKATVDLDKIGQAQSGDTVTLNVDVKLPEVAGNGFEMTSKTPATVDVKLEKLVSQDMSVSVQVSGSAADGFKLTTPEVSPSIVTVSGGQSLMSTVATARVNVSVEEIDSDAVLTGNVVLYDKNGIEVKGVTLSPKQVKVSLGVNQNKNLTVRGSTVGSPASGYVVGKITFNPQTIEVYGSKQTLSHMTDLVLPEIDVRNMRESIVQTFDTADVLPEGLKATDNAPDSIEVQVDIEPEATKQITISTDRIYGNHIGENLEYRYPQPSLSFQVQGPAPDINTLLNGDVTGSVDLTNLEAGRHTVTVDLVLPSSVTLSGNVPTMDVVITEKEPTNESNTGQGQTPVTTPENPTPTEKSEEQDSANDVENQPTETQQPEPVQE